MSDQPASHIRLLRPTAPDAEGRSVLELLTLDEAPCTDSTSVPRPRLPSRPRKPTLADREPDVAAALDAVIAYWRQLTGQRPHGGTRKQVEPLVREYSVEDITGTMDDLWCEVDRYGRPTGFWQQGNMSWAAIGNRIEAHKAGRLRRSRGASPEEGGASR